MAEYTYDDATGTYRDADGSPLDEAAVLAALAALILALDQATAAPTVRLTAQQLPVDRWQAETSALLAAGHLDATALAVGGWAHTDRAVQEWAARQTHAQLGFLAGFAAAITAGTLSAAATLARMGLYPPALWSTYQARRAEDARRRGQGEVRNVLGGAQHCAQCLAETARGWVPVGALSLPGSRTCRSNCRCYLAYRAVPVGAVP